MVSIGEFARLTGLSVKALRHYDAIGLFPADAVDPGTLHRKYVEGQVACGRQLAQWRAAGLPLAQMRLLLAGSADDVLDQHRRRLEARLERTRAQLHALMHLMEGSPMNAPQTPPLTEEQQRALAVGLFNKTWEFLEIEDRTAAQDDEMLHAAHASRHHWGGIGGPEHLARGEWLCSRVYAVLGRPEAAMHHAQRTLSLCEANDLADWDLAFAHEALARAAAVAGDRESSKKSLQAARAVVVAEEEDRAILDQDLDTIAAMLT